MQCRSVIGSTPRCRRRGTRGRRHLLLVSVLQLRRASTATRHADRSVEATHSHARRVVMQTAIARVLGRDAFAANEKRIAPRFTHAASFKKRVRISLRSEERGISRGDEFIDRSSSRRSIDMESRQKRCECATLTARVGKKSRRTTNWVSTKSTNLPMIFLFELIRTSRGRENYG